MRIGVTGATGFVGLELVRQLLVEGHSIRVWHRPKSDLRSLQSLSAFCALSEGASVNLSAEAKIEFVCGELGEGREEAFVEGCDAIVHSGLWRESASFQESPSSVAEYARVNIVGTLALIEASVRLQLSRFVFVSTCAVHDVVLDDRLLDEAHPCWPKSHYGAHKAAIEKFVHSFGHGEGFPICAIRPTAVYGIEPKFEKSRWHALLQSICQNAPTRVSGGGKLVHVSDVAKATRLLLDASPDKIAGEVFSCCDRYISNLEVAMLAKQLAKSDSEVLGEPGHALHEIDTTKIRNLGMSFGGLPKLNSTLATMIDRIKESPQP